MEKGFTLFTALVAVMLVFLGILLTQSMIRGERSLVDIITNVEEESAMLDFASIRKTDAIQEFNFGLRVAVEKYFTKDERGGGPKKNLPDGVPDNPFTIENEILDYLTPETQWDYIKAEFIRQNFGDLTEGYCVLGDPLNLSIQPGEDCKAKQFVYFTAGEIINTLHIENVKGPYHSRIDKIDEQDYKLKFERILLDVFARSAFKEDFLTVSDCDGGYFNGCDGGGFYINLDFSRRGNEIGATGISDEVYEMLPQIIVKKKDTCTSNENDDDILENCTKVLKQPIFPRSAMRIFVPTRIFKALKGAHEIITSGGNKIVFDKDSEFKNKITELKLGVCDSKRISIYTMPAPKPPKIDDRGCTTFTWHACKPRESFEKPQSVAGFGGKACIGDTSEGSAYQWRDVGISELSLLSLQTYNPNTDTDAGQFSVQNAFFKFVSETKLPELLSPTSNTVITSFEQANANPISDFKLKKDGSNYFWELDVESFSFSSREIRPPGFSTCSKVSKLSWTLVFEEQNKTYIINTNQPTRFAIRIVDSEFPAFGHGADSTEKIVTSSEGEGIQCATEYIRPTGRLQSVSCPDPNDYGFGIC